MSISPWIAPCLRNLRNLHYEYKSTDCSVLTHSRNPTGIRNSHRSLRSRCCIAHTCCRLISKACPACKQSVSLCAISESPRIAPCLQHSRDPAHIRKSCCSHSFASLFCSYGLASLIQEQPGKQACRLFLYGDWAFTQKRTTLEKQMLSRRPTKLLF